MNPTKCMSNKYCFPTCTFLFIATDYNNIIVMFYRRGLLELMAPSVDSALLVLSCPCTLYSDTTPNLQRRRLKQLLKV